MTRDWRLLIFWGGLALQLALGGTPLDSNENGWVVNLVGEPPKTMCLSNKYKLTDTKLAKMTHQVTVGCMSSPDFCEFVTFLGPGE